MLVCNNIAMTSEVNVEVLCIIWGVVARGIRLVYAIALLSLVHRIFIELQYTSLNGMVVWYDAQSIWRQASQVRALGGSEGLYPIQLWFDAIKRRQPSSLKVCLSFLDAT
jgi:hypothetical protein